MKTRMLKIAASAALLVTMVILGTNASKASCKFYDEEYDYLLICIGESGSCKFINPEGQYVICTGNQAEAIPGRDVRE